VNTRYSAGADAFFDETIDFDFDQDGQLGAISLAFATEITSTLSIGVTWNFWRDSPFGDNGWSQREDVTTEIENPFDGDLISTSTDVSGTYSNVKGENFTLGLLWNFRPKWNLGLRYDTAFRTEADYQVSEVIDGVVSPPIPMQKRHVNFPYTFAAGIAYRPNDRFTIALDVSETDWDDFTVSIPDGRVLSLVDAAGRTGTGVTNFKKTTTARIGFEYLFLPEELDENMNSLWSLRWGVLYDEEPASGAPGRQDGQPEEFWGVSLGLGLQLFQCANLDIAYQARFADNVNGDYIRGVEGFDEDVLQHRVLLSTVIYF